MKPFLKWAGNKYRIINQIKSVLPKGNRLIEPFCGSCAVFLNVEYDSYIIADSNADLINLFLNLQSEGIRFIDYAASFFKSENNSELKYYEFRDVFNNTEDAWLKSALFLYLNRHCYNGLCRYNKSGKFNSPFGAYIKPYFPQNEMIAFYQKSNQAEFKCQSFDVTMDMAVVGDVVYCDPPYAPLNNTSNFTGYHTNGFSIKDQICLAEKAKQLSSADIPVVISNHNTTFIQETYSTADIIQFDVRRFISCDGANRSHAPELLAVFK